MNYETLKNVTDWATSDDTGSSSMAMCRFMLGLPPKDGYYSHPYDAGDRGRCIRLLNLIPEWWDRIDEMAALPTHKSYMFSNGKITIKESGWREQIPLIKKEANRE